jgi:isopentenyl-diphosphate Delta-isomerase
MEEYFDILDENGDIKGITKPRSEAHTRGLWHRTVHIYFYRLNNGVVELLVHLRSKTKDLNPNKWDTRFGGHIKAGETINQALENEINEETGLRLVLSNLKEGPTGKHDKFPNREFVHTYFYNFTGDTNELTFNDGEVQEVRWVSDKDILEAMEHYPEQWTGSPTGLNKTINALQDLIEK